MPCPSAAGRRAHNQRPAGRSCIDLVVPSTPRDALPSPRRGDSSGPSFIMVALYHSRFSWPSAREESPPSRALSPTTRSSSRGLGLPKPCCPPETPGTMPPRRRGDSSGPSCLIVALYHSRSLWRSAQEESPCRARRGWYTQPRRGETCKGG